MEVELPYILSEVGRDLVNGGVVGAFLIPIELVGIYAEYLFKKVGVIDNCLLASCINPMQYS